MKNWVVVGFEQREVHLDVCCENVNYLRVRSFRVVAIHFLVRPRFIPLARDFASDT